MIRSIYLFIIAVLVLQPVLATEPAVETSQAVPSRLTSEALMEPLLSSTLLARRLFGTKIRSVSTSHAAYIAKGAGIRAFSYFRGDHQLKIESRHDDRSWNVVLKDLPIDPFKRFLADFQLNGDTPRERFWMAIRALIREHMNNGVWMMHFERPAAAAFFAFAHSDSTYDRIGVGHELQDEMLVYVHEFLELMMLTKVVDFTYDHDAVYLRVLPTGLIYEAPISDTVLRALRAEEWWLLGQRKKITVARRRHRALRIIELIVFGEQSVRLSLKIQTLQGAAKVFFPDDRFQEVLGQDRTVRDRYVQAYALVANRLLIPFNHMHLKGMLANLAFHLATYPSERSLDDTVSRLFTNVHDDLWQVEDGRKVALLKAA